MEKEKKPCPEGKRRNQKGRCVKNCSIDKEVINDKCLKKCAPNKIRNENTNRCIKDKSLLTKEPKEKKPRKPRKPKEAKKSEEPKEIEMDYLNYLKTEYKKELSPSKRKFLIDTIAGLPAKYMREIMK